MINEPFAQEKLNNIFKVSKKQPDRLVSRESSNLELKLSFGWKGLPKYLKSIAAFANSKGGYFVFGVANNPRLLVGLNEDSKKLFEDIDPETLTKHLNDCFSPEILWDIQEYDLNGNYYGLIYVYEAQEKPIICKKNYEELKEGDIYYRYRAKSERIKYPELRDIFESQRQKEKLLWLQHLSKIARIGVNDIGIFNLQTGEVSGSAGSLFIDESLLSQLSFIKEGEFSEIKGKPTLKLIGQITTLTGLPIQSKGRSIVKKGIRISDIILAFLKHEKVQEPKDYITQICFESTAFLPIYYYLKLGNLDINESIQLINNTVCRSTSRYKLIDRLKKGYTQNLVISECNSPSAIKKRNFIEQLIQHQVNVNIVEKDVLYCLQSIRSLTRGEIEQNRNYICNLLNNWFNKYYSSPIGSIANDLRRAICWVDEALYKD